MFSQGNRSVDEISVPLVNGLVDLAVEQRLSPLLTKDEMPYSFVFDVFEIDPTAPYWDFMHLIINFFVYVFAAYLILRVRKYYFSR
jgi:hypothetical protein